MQTLNKTLPLFLLFVLFGAFSLQAQVKIGDNPEIIDTGSLLELNSIDKALVITRVSTAQMQNMTPLQGAVVYNTDDACVNYFDGTEWINICEAFGALNITSTAIQNDLETIVVTRLNEDGIEDVEGAIFNIEVSAINGDNIQDGVIDSNHLVDGAIGRDQIAENAVSTTEIADGGVRTIDIRPGDPNEVLQTSDSGDLVQWGSLNADNITGENLTASDTSITVTSGDGATLINASVQVSEGGITENKLADNAVTNTKIDKTNIPISGFGAAIEAIDLGGNTISNLAEPSLDQDAVTKFYVDSQVGSINMLDDGLIYVGNTINEATAVPVSGDITLINTGELTINDDAITSSKISNETILSEDILDGTIADADILDRTISPLKLADGVNDGQILRYNGTDWELANENALAITEAQDLESVLTFDPSANNIVITDLGTPIN
ncbi:hypothetical protein KO500_01140, partial [Cellulophaga baltica]|nr:hypothetical protein [Cellulophaga baltica]MDO6766408.1 hypothetical protein [Cellulophaga sp. 1_MG-2023]